MKASRNDKGAIIRALDSEIQGAVRDLKKEINFQLNNDGTSRRCLVNGDPSTGTTLTVDAPGTNYLYDGMIIDVLGIDDGDGATNDADVVITTVDSATEVTVSAALDAAIDDNDWVVRANSTDGAGVLASDSYEMMGIKGIVDDATYVDTLHNLARGSYAWWKCSTFTNDDNSGTNRDLSLDLIQEAITAVEKNGDNVNLIVSSPEMRDAYAALLVADKRFVNTLDLDGGFKALEYSGIPWVADSDCQPNTVFFLNTDRLFIMQMGDWDWMDEIKRNCPLKIVLFAGTSDEYEGANYAKIRHCGQSAGKLDALAGGYDRWGRFILNHKKVGEGEPKTVFLSRHPDSKYESIDNRQNNADYRQNLWLSCLAQTAEKQALSLAMESSYFRLQAMQETPASDYSLPLWKERGSRIFAEVCSDERNKQRGKAIRDESSSQGIEESPETLRTTVCKTDDKVRATWRHAELGGNDLAANYIN